MAAGRAEAKRRRLRVTGTLGVRRSGAEHGLVNVPDLIERRKKTSFYLDDALVSTVFAPWLPRSQRSALVSSRHNIPVLVKP